MVLTIQTVFFRPTNIFLHHHSQIKSFCAERNEERINVYCCAPKGMENRDFSEWGAQLF